MSKFNGTRTLALFGARMAQNVEHLPVGPVADGMHQHRQAVRACAEDLLTQLFHIGDRHAHVRRLGFVRCQHPRCAGSQGAVGE